MLGRTLWPVTILLPALAAACASNGDAPTAIVGATVIDGTGAPALSNAAIVIRAGRIEAIGSRGAVSLPTGTRIVDAAGKVIIPGLINTHVHVGDTRGLESGHYSHENVLRHLRLYARYGVTTVNSLGGDGEASIQIREATAEAPLDHARLLVAGPVVAGETPAEALAMVDQNAAMGVDFIKIRVDDFLGTRTKMTPGIYRSVIDRAHVHDIPVAAHLFYLEDAKSLLRADVDFLAHGVRDQPVDAEFIASMLERGICLTPTLTRDLSTFVYEDVPGFFGDPFFLMEVDREILDRLKDASRQREVREDPLTPLNKKGLSVGMENLGRLADAGVRVVLGTDTGPPGRFQGYFAHLEMDMMVESGLTPHEAIIAATGDAAHCLGLRDLGTLTEGNWADLVILTANPLDDITNTRTVESVWIGGQPLEGTDR